MLPLRATILDGGFTVFVDDLSSGIYTYSIIIDGKAIATKRLAKQT